MLDARATVGREAGNAPEPTLRDGRLNRPAGVGVDPAECLDKVQDAIHRAWRAEPRSQLGHMARLVGLGALTASIAHEVSQPLSAININASTCLRMLAADPPDIEGARETARLTVRDGKRAADVVTSLRVLFSRSEPVTKLVDLNEATRGAVSLLVAELRSSAVLLQLDLLDQLPPVSGDGVQIQQVMLNLISNALDAMRNVDGRPRQLTIRTGHDDGRVRFSVRDVGTGIEPHDVDRLFEPFYTTKTKGMGIGLAVSRSIVESHGGRLWATSNGGPGATFSFSIPATSREAIAAQKTRPPMALRSQP